MNFNFLVGLLFFFTFSLFSQQQIQHLSGPFGGTVEDLSVSSNGDLYAGAYPFAFIYSDGLYKSTDKGATWSELKNSSGRFQVLSILNAKNGDIWIGTYYGGILFHSTDKGQTWENKANGVDGGMCWALTEDTSGNIIAGTPIGIYKTVDNGNNWNFLSSPNALSFALDKNGNIYAGSYSGGLFKSTNNGNSWIKNSNFPNLTVPVIFIDSVSNNVYCGSGYYSNGNGVYRSTDNGSTWINIGLQGKSITGLVKNSAGYLIAGARDKDSSLFISSNEGLSWEKSGQGLKVEISRLRADEKGHLYACSENEGVFKSTDGGITFSLIGLPIAKTSSIQISKNGNYIFTATYSGIQRYDRIKKVWENKFPKIIKDITIANDDVLYAATYFEGVYRSSDAGENWQLMAFKGHSTETILSINDSVLVLACDSRYYISRDAGQSWDTTSINYTENSNAIYYDKVNGRLFLTAKDKIFYSTDQGENFTSIASPSTMIYKHGLAADKNGNLYYVSQIVPSSMYKINYPYNGSWTIEFQDASSVYSDENTNLIAGAHDGVYSYNSNSNSWDLMFNENMPFLSVLDMKKSSGSLLLATDSYGVYEIENFTGIKDKLIQNFSHILIQNYPNPFNPSTRINYQIPERGNVTIKVFDILGNELKTLVNELKEKGEYEITFDAKDFASGIYIYQIKSGNFFSSRKMTLIK